MPVCEVGAGSIKDFGETEQESALVDVQEIVAAVFHAMGGGKLDPFALMSAVRGAGSTFTVTESDALPPTPVQDSVYVWLAVRFPVDMPAFEVPVHPVGETEQELALVDVQDIVAAVLNTMVIGPFDPFASISAVGGVSAGPISHLVSHPPSSTQL